MKTVFLFCWVFCLVVFPLFSKAGEVVLVRDGQNAVPILVPAEGSEETLRAAETLADYIEKISGARPAVQKGPFANLPASAIWIGWHPELNQAFPGVSWDFTHPEEIAIIAKGNHLAIAGRDLMGAGEGQTEFGTANAVYTFLQKYLHVRWLWPGPLGEDVIAQKTISFPSFEYRFHPVFLQRGIFRNLKTESALKQWCRVQRIGLDSFKMPVTHAFTTWWDKYHETNPDYFALQPDGTRSGYPSPNRAKIFEANPKVWKQWLDNAEKELKQNPSLTILHAAQNDSSNSGVGVDPESQAWDSPKGAPYVYSYDKGVRKEYVAMTDRNVKFWNKLAEGLRERLPEKQLYVGGFAYGPTKFPPVDTDVDKSIVIAYVGHFPVRDEENRAIEKEEWRGWAEKASHLIYRPNLFIYSGPWHAMPSTTLKNTIEDFRFLAENRCMGMTIDTTPEFWANQVPQYYLMGQLAWDPFQDGTTLLKDFYQRAFGKAAGEIEAYFDLAEAVHARILSTPGWRPSRGNTKQMIAQLPKMYDQAYFDRATELLAKADATVATEPEIYRQRLAFLRTGLDFAKVQIELIPLMTRVRESNGADFAAVNRAVELCRQRDGLLKQHGGIALSAHRFNVTFLHNRNTDLRPFMGPPTEEQQAAAKGESSQSEGVIPVIQKDDAVPAKEESRKALKGTSYRWSGKGTEPIWSLPANWEVKKGSRWVEATQPPDSGSEVILSDASAVDGPQSIQIDSNIVIKSLTIEARSNARSYTIQNRRYDGEGDDLDSDSGRLFSLEITEAEPIIQSVASRSDLTFEVGLRFSHHGAPTVVLGSRKKARVIATRPVQSGAPVQIEMRGPDANGIFEQSGK